LHQGRAAAAAGCIIVSNVNKRNHYDKRRTYA
jgi:hypothetical protein